MVADEDLPDSWREFVDTLAQRPGGQWVAEIYVAIAAHQQSGRLVKR
jgi:hypothetical protein